MRYLAIDYGSKRIGLAYCDQSETLCSPIKVIPSGEAIAQILKLIEEYDIEAVVVGLPVNMDGTEGGQARETKKFTEFLREKIGEIPICFQDERLSSFDAQQRLANKGLTNKKNKQKLDAVAAASILEDYLEHKKSDN